MSHDSAFQLCKSVEEALKGIGKGQTHMVGGFGLSGIPENIIEHVRTRDDISDLRIISTEAGDDGWGLGRLYEKNKIAKQWASYIGRCHSMEKAYLEGRCELELIPQGTLAEKVRGAAFNLPAFFSSCGLHTNYADGKLAVRYNSDGSVKEYNKKRETREFNGRQYLLEEAFPRADYAWIKASKADKMGNCVFKGTSMNFNTLMAKAAHVTIVEAEEIVEIGDIKPEEVHLPGLYVNRLFKGAKFEHRVEILKTSDDDQGDAEAKDPRSVIAARAAKEFFPGMNCNLGVGMPTLAAKFAAAQGTHVFLQSENGMTGVGGYPHKNDVDSDWINAGKETITPVPGSSTFASDESFGQIRGGHLDLTVLGALEVSQYGDIANYMIPGKMVKGMGGAMDLVSNPEQTRVMVTQQHNDKHGGFKIKEKCDLPLTGAKCVHVIVTELAIFDVDHEKGLTLREYSPDTSIDEIKKKTGAPFKVADKCGPWKI